MRPLCNLLGISRQGFYKHVEKVSEYGAQNEAYNVERGRKTPKAVYLQRVMGVEAVMAT